MFPSAAYRPNHLNLLDILNFTGVEKAQEDDVPQNGFEKHTATGPMPGNVILCFVKQTKAKINFCSRVRLFCSLETTVNFTEIICCFELQTSPPSPIRLA